MKFKIGAMLESFKCSPDEAVKKCVELGVSGIQFYAGMGSMDVDKLTDSEIVRFAELISDNNLVISAICGDLGGFGFEKKEDNGFKKAKSKRIIDLAVRLNTNVVTTHIGVLPVKPDEVYENIYNACTELGRYAFERGVTFAIETGPETMRTLKDFLDSLPTKGIGVNFDPANIVMVTGDDYIGGVRLLNNYIVHTHAKDGVMLKKAKPEFLYHKFAMMGVEDFDSSEYLIEKPLGEGDVKFVEYLNALTDIGYSGFLTIEREVGDTPYADIKKAVDFLKEIMAGATIQKGTEGNKT